MTQPVTTAAMPPLEVARTVAARPGLVRFFPKVSLHPLPARGDVSLGRSDTASIELQDARASREHALLRRNAGALRVRPVHARNGVFVDGRRVQDEAPLVAGSVLRCGAEFFVYRDELPEMPSATHDASNAHEAGVGPVWHARAIEAVEEAARRGFDLLLLGDTGTGKDVLARHFARVARPDGPFVALNLAAINTQLFESELFGHARGAFTGAHESRKGAFRRADGGVLFLDEVGALAPEHHFKLHRVLEERCVRAQGTDTDLPVDVLVVSATEQPLDALCRRGEFETSLYQRLRRAEVRLRPLRERVEDLPTLVAALLSAALGVPISMDALHPELVELLALQPWPGNVRQLQNFIAAHARALTDLNRPDLARLRAGLHEDDAPPDGLAVQIAREAHGDRSVAAPLAELLRDDERRYLRAALDAVGGSKTRAAQRLGISRQHLHRRLRQLGITDAGDGGDEGEPCA